MKIASLFRPRLLPLLGGMGLAVSVVTAVADSVLEVEGVSGDAIQPKGAIAVESYSFSLQTRGEFTFSADKGLDSSTVPLQLLCASGKSAKQAVFSVFAPGLPQGSPAIYKITMEDVTVVSAGMSGSAFQTRESYTLKFSRVFWQYVGFDAAGKASSTNKAGWNVVDGKAL